MNKYFIPCAIIIAMMFANSVVLARGGHYGKNRDRCKYDNCRERCYHRDRLFDHPKVMKQELSLTDDQFEKVRKITIAYKEKLPVIREKMVPLRKKLKDMLSENDINLGKVRSLVETLSAHKLDFRMLKIQQRIDIQKILTSSQKEKLRNKCRLGTRDSYGPCLYLQDEF